MKGLEFKSHDWKTASKPNGLIIPDGNSNGNQNPDTEKTVQCGQSKNKTIQKADILMSVI